MADVKAFVTLYRDRWKEGTLSFSIGAIRNEFRCLGRSDNAAAAKVGNPTRDPKRPFGDLPTGEHRAIRTVKGLQERTYGPGPRWLLEGIAGDALAAVDNGRYGIMIHGGVLAADGKRLRPTHGCLRVDNSTIEWMAANCPKTFPVYIQELP